MTDDAVTLDTVDSTGDLSPVTLILGDPAQAHVRLIDRGGTVFETSGDDYMSCLLAVREHLEKHGRLLCCQGARPDVWPSGMLRQFSNGREAYVLDRERRGEEPEVVDIYAPAPANAMVSLSRQREAVLAFHGLPAKDPKPE